MLKIIKILCNFKKKLKRVAVFAHVVTNRGQRDTTHKRWVQDYWHAGSRLSSAIASGVVALRTCMCWRKTTDLIEANLN